MAKYKAFNEIMDHPAVPAATKQQLFQAGMRSRREERLRAELSKHNYRLMHRRGGQYWVIYAQPQTLDDIEAALASRRA